MSDRSKRGLRPSLPFAIVCAAVVLAAEARADWEYTRWGMTPDEVVAASRGAARLGAPPKGKTYLPKLIGRALGTHQVDGARFDAYFHFDSANALAKVALERTGGTECGVLLNGLNDRFGPPIKSHRQSFAIIEQWRDSRGGNVVNYIEIGRLPCTITYDRPPR